MPVLLASWKHDLAIKKILVVRRINTMRRTEKMKITEMLRLSEIGMSQREIAAGAGCGKSTIGDVLKLCKEKGISYEAASRLTDAELHAALYQTRSQSKPPPD